MNGFSKWIINGEWNDEVISKEIQLFLDKEKAATPLEIIRTHKLPEVDEIVIDEGFKDLLVEAYAGKLSLDEYVLFLIIVTILESMTLIYLQLIGKR